VTSSTDLETPGRKPGLTHYLFRHQLPLESETSFFILVNVMDFFLTYWGIWNGLLRESNWIAKWFLDGWGLIKGLLMYKLVLVVLVCGIAQIVATQQLETARKLLLYSSLLVLGVVVYSAWLLLTHNGPLHAEEFDDFDFVNLLQAASAMLRRA